MQNPESQWELLIEAPLQYEHSIFPSLQSTQPHKKYCLDHKEQRDSASGLQLYCSPAKREFWMPFLSPEVALCKIYGRSQNWNSSLSIFRKITILKSYVSFCVIPLLFLTSITDPPVCSSMVTWSVQTQNRQLAVARELTLISMLSLPGSRNLELFSADHSSLTLGYKNLRYQQQLNASRTWKWCKDF